MKEYYTIVIGTGSAMNFVSALQNRNPEIKIAVIDKDEPGGICLTRGCIPYAIFSHPEISAAGMKEKEAIERYGEDNILIGIYRYQDTAKGDAMEVKDCFVKVIVEKDTSKILGAHIIGPHASILIQEIVNIMYTPEQSLAPIRQGMHIHPALSEVVEKAFGSLIPSSHYHHTLKHFQLEH